MAKLIGPLLSFGASGQIGKGMVTASWRGVKYARQYVIPANPRSTAQQANRTRFALLREMYKLAPAALRAPWDAFAKGRPFLPVNKFVGENNRMLVGASDFSTGLMSPGAKGGIPPTSMTATAGASTGEIDIEVVVPTQLPDGWSIDSIGAAAFPEQDPVGLFVGPLVADTAASPADTVTLSGFEASTPLACFGWVIYEKPSGELAYSVSLYDAANAAA